MTSKKLKPLDAAIEIEAHPLVQSVFWQKIEGIVDGKHKRGVLFSVLSAHERYVPAASFVATGELETWLPSFMDGLRELNEEILKIETAAIMASGMGN